MRPAFPVRVGQHPCLLAPTPMSLLAHFALAAWLGLSVGFGVVANRAVMNADHR